ncbi:MAG: cytochrome b/b6 domain-containing protein [Solimonas sp.]
MSLPPRDAAPFHKAKVWDLPLRLFHWLLVLAVLVAYVTGEWGGAEYADWHARSGEAILGLLVFRLLWGFIGPETARFASFWPTPARLRAYFAKRWQGAGHNPLGAFAVIALLGVLAAQVGTGLFANDDIAFTGPLASLVSKARSDALSGWHQRLFYALAALVLLHVAAIAFYEVFLKKRLVLPMLSGRKALSAVIVAPRLARRPLALVIAVLAAGVAVWVVVGGIRAPDAIAAPPPAATPAW